MRFIVNPPGMVSVRRHGKPASRKAFHAAGYSRNAPRKRASAKQLAARKKFVAMVRARAKASGSSRARKRSTRSVGMARRKRKAVTRRSPRRKRRHVTARRRVYAANPRRRKRSRSRAAVRHRKGVRRYRRNPGFGSGILGQVLNVATAGAAVAGGRVAYNVVHQQFGSVLASATDTPTTAAAKNLLVGAVVGVGIKMIGRKMGAKGSRLADYAAAGAVSAPILALLATLAPASMTTYLGDGVMAMPRFTGRRTISAYPGGVAAYSETLGAYSESAPY
jgi:hypothetical protein